jgi:hypothetical protein
MSEVTIMTIDQDGRATDGQSPDAMLQAESTFPLPLKLKIFSDWRRFLRGGFQLSDYHQVLHLYLLDAGLVELPSHPIESSRLQVWAHYFHDDLLRTSDFLAQIAYLRVDAGAGSATPHPIPMAGYVTDPADGIDLLSAIRQDLLEIYDALTYCIEEIIEEKDNAIKRSEHRDRAADLKQTKYPYLSIDQIIEEHLPALHLVPGYYLEGDASLPIDDEMRTALSKMCGGALPKATPITQPALFETLRRRPARRPVLHQPQPTPSSRQTMSTGQSPLRQERQMPARSESKSKRGSYDRS